MPPKKAAASDAPTVRFGRTSGNLKMGLVGLPNVGKSSLFNILCGMSVPAENFPFCTIDETVSKVEVPDERFDFLVEKCSPKSRVPAVLTVFDIAGLIKGASEGAGLGNAFLANIAAVDGIFHLCRAFPSSEVVHVDGEVNPVRDLDVIHGELRAKDIAQASGWIEKNSKNIERGIGGKDAKTELEIIQRAKERMEAGEDVRYGTWTAAEVEVLNKHLFLTSKPMVYLVNLSEKAYIKKSNKWLPLLGNWLKERGGVDKMIPISVVFEQKLLDLGGYQTPEAMAYQKEKGARSALPKIIKAGYAALDLINFFTAGPDEVRAWTVRRGTLAPRAAGTIHTDIEQGFICADTMGFEDFKEHGGEAAVKAAGRMRMEGRKYEVQDGDICHFKHNTGKKKK